ncbi:hypothetical protein A9Q93_06005 [Nonlabens dokdonensis]|uniref:Transcription regulator BetR N-terminal domain-containing protein n=1 Tax=Nonlabens dokdonensis TaxID=328515 RepID=A0A1Z8B0C5_9FLAO|nr:hypothetical protein [Nonlabens dokdonensis]OUS16017.1 hypothetical protein A9Q93_06005 [Nonlabens dokdonensis]
MQEQFISKIKSILNENQSVTEEIAAVLDISYDAAYRRVTGKTSISLEESVILSKHFKISLNKLFEVGEQTSILTDVSPSIENMAQLEQYFDTSLQNILPLTNLKSASITYSAKDIPLFYTLSDSYLTKYKCYVWLKFLNEDGSMEKMSFKNFMDQAPKSLFESAIRLGETYNYIDIVEFWNDNTINGTLQQIFYYYETGLLSRALALLICKDLKDIIDHVEKQSIQQTIINSKNNAQYHLYKSDLLTMSNTIMVKTKNQKVFFSPFTVLTYFKVEHQATCDKLDRFFEKQMKNSKLLVNSGERDRAQFFNKMHLKVDSVIERININQDLIYF